MQTVTNQNITKPNTANCKKSGSVKQGRFYFLYGNRTNLSVLKFMRKSEKVFRTATRLKREIPKLRASPQAPVNPLQHPRRLKVCDYKTWGSAPSHTATRRAQAVLSLAMPMRPATRRPRKRLPRPCKSHRSNQPNTGVIQLVGTVFRIGIDVHVDGDFTQILQGFGGVHGAGHFGPKS